MDPRLGTEQDVVEGIVDEKHVDRILQKDALERIVHDLTKQGQLVNALVQKKGKEVLETQEDLQRVTLDLASTEGRLAELKENASAGLSDEALFQCHSGCNNVLVQFLVQKGTGSAGRGGGGAGNASTASSPTNVAKNEMKVEVVYHVKSVTGKPVVEGSGSLLAVFMVQVDAKILSLQQQAAKYWGLEQEIVFFLDREGQLVPDSMTLGEIILPAGSDYVVSNQYYRFTLVKATTELVVVDTLAPKGQKWRDFSFNHPFLKQQLALHRKLRGQMEIDLDPVDPSKIPTLQELIERGRIKRQKAVFDLQCRFVECLLFLLFVVMLYLFLDADRSAAFNLRQVQLNLQSRVSYRETFVPPSPTQLAFLPPAARRRRLLGIMDEQPPTPRELMSDENGSTISPDTDTTYPLSAEQEAFASTQGAAFAREYDVLASTSSTAERKLTADDPEQELPDLEEEISPRRLAEIQILSTPFSVWDTRVPATQQSLPAVRTRPTFMEFGRSALPLALTEDASNAVDNLFQLGKAHLYVTEPAASQASNTLVLAPLGSTLSTQQTQSTHTITASLTFLNYTTAEVATLKLLYHEATYETLCASLVSGTVYATAAVCVSQTTAVTTWARLLRNLLLAPVDPAGTSTGNTAEQEEPEEERPLRRQLTTATATTEITISGGNARTSVAALAVMRTLDVAVLQNATFAALETKLGALNISTSGLTLITTGIVSATSFAAVTTTTTVEPVVNATNGTNGTNLTALLRRLQLVNEEDQPEQRPKTTGLLASSFDGDRAGVATEPLPGSLEPTSPSSTEEETPSNESPVVDSQLMRSQRGGRALQSTSSSLSYTESVYPCPNDRAAAVQKMFGDFFAQCRTSIEDLPLPEASADPDYLLDSTGASLFLTDLQTALTAKDTTLAYARAFLFNTFFYNSNEEGLVVSRLLFDIRNSGGVGPVLQVQYQTTKGASTGQVIFIVFATIFSIAVFLLSLRRIVKPHFKEEAERFSLYSHGLQLLLFIVLLTFMIMFFSTSLWAVGTDTAEELALERTGANSTTSSLSSRRLEEEEGMSTGVFDSSEVGNLPTEPREGANSGLAAWFWRKIAGPPYGRENYQYGASTFDGPNNARQEITEIVTSSSSWQSESVLSSGDQFLPARETETSIAEKGLKDSGSSIVRLLQTGNSTTTTSTTTAIPLTVSEKIAAASSGQWGLQATLVILLLCMNTLALRYFIGFFPQLKLAKSILLRAMRPLFFSTCAFVILPLLGTAVLLLSAFHTSRYAGSQGWFVLMAGCRLLSSEQAFSGVFAGRDDNPNAAAGALSRSKSHAASASEVPLALATTSTLELLVQFFLFMVVFLFGEQLLVAIMVNGMKELSLRESAEFHYAWQNQDPLTFNPSKHSSKPMLCHPVHPDDFYIAKEEEDH
ncbi:unnamed protein product [Amoebophrya sp. A120]|nr:unnamed protein product [Amoebophrya sp. A120]|eukprot:GSA120T00001526001.1